LEEIAEYLEDMEEVMGDVEEEDGEVEGMEVVVARLDVGEVDAVAAEGEAVVEAAVEEEDAIE
jgi:hypothetical protein